MSLFFNILQVFRADYIGWCLPPFPDNYSDYSCSFLATGGDMYFINHTATEWYKYDCCLFEGVRKTPLFIYHNNHLMTGARDCST